MENELALLILAVLVGVLIYFFFKVRGLVAEQASYARLRYHLELAAAVVAQIEQLNWIRGLSGMEKKAAARKQLAVLNLDPETLDTLIESAVYHLETRHVKPLPEGES